MKSKRFVLGDVHGRYIALKEVLKKCSKIIINGVVRNITSQDKQHILAKNEEYAKEALRVIGFA